MAVKAHPGVYDCVVAGRPSERWGNEVVAIVRRRDGAEVTEESPAHRGRAATSPATSCPKGIVFVDEIVRSPSGKADYRWARQVAGRHHRRSAVHPVRHRRSVAVRSASWVAGCAVGFVAAGRDACSAGAPTTAPTAAPTIDGRRNPVATFQVVDETYKIELATPELADHARRLLAGEEVAADPAGHGRA